MTDDTGGGPDRLQSGLRSGVAALEWVSSLLLFAMMALTFVDVVGRYLFAAPVFGGSEILSAMLAFTIFAGLGITNARDDHIVLELFDHHVRRFGGRTYDVVIQGFSIAAMALIAWVLTEAALEAWDYDTRSYVLGIPAWITVTGISALAILSVATQIAGVVLMLRRPAAARGG